MVLCFVIIKRNLFSCWFYLVAGLLIHIVIYCCCCSIMCLGLHTCRLRLLLLFCLVFKLNCLFFNSVVIFIGMV